MAKEVKEWSYSVERAEMCYTVQLIQAQRDGSEKRADILLLDLSWSEADNLGKLICDEFLGAKTVMIDTTEEKRRRIKYHKSAIARYLKDIERERAAIEKLRS